MLAIPTIGEFLHNLIFYGLEHYRRYYGVYRAVVTRNDDPEQRGRIQAWCRSFQSEAPDVWIDCAFSGAGTDRGCFWPPEVGDGARIAFDRGDPGKPVIYWGGWFGKNELATEEGMGFGYSDKGFPEQRGIRTRAGHTVVFGDEAGKEFIRVVWHQPDSSDSATTDRTLSADMTKGEFAYVEIDKTGSVALSNKSGSRLQLRADKKAVLLVDENGNSITLDPDGIKIVDKGGNLFAFDKGKGTLVIHDTFTVTCKSVNLKTGGVFLGDGASSSAVLGEALITWLATHTHPTAAPGPPSNPTVPPPGSILSTSVKLK